LETITKPTDSTHPALPAALNWLQDAALYTDDGLIERFYDAIANPENRQKSVGLTFSDDTSTALKGKLGVDASVTTEKLAALVMPLFGFIKPTLKVAGEAGVDHENHKSASTTLELETIDNPQRQLKQLALYYLFNQSQRLFFADLNDTKSWTSGSSIAEVPRALTFLSLPSAAEAAEKGLPETKLIPTAAEFENGKIVQIYKSLAFTDEELPAYPERGSNEERAKYWAWFDTKFSATKAMIAVENAASENGKIRWIDYRLPISRSGDTLHLHLCPAGNYDTGVFAYNFIKRGFKHGIRLVGSMKSEPDMNVLAIFDR
jgi:hypothetical protein